MLVVGMFDDADSLEEGLERLTEAGLDERVQRLEGAPTTGNPTAAGASEGGAEPVDLARGAGTTAPWPGQVRSSEPPMIGGRVLDDEEREYYRRLLEDGGRLLLVEIDAARADEAEKVLDGAGATRVARHER
ncbi:MAG TPA: hypothetical protein VF168_01170 [Trueperaceae bacterium]